MPLATEEKKETAPQESMKLTKVVELYATKSLTSNPDFSNLSEATKAHIRKNANDFFYAILSGNMPQFISDHKNEFWPPKVRDKVSKELLRYAEKMKPKAAEVAVGFHTIGLEILSRKIRESVLRFERDMSPKQRKSYKSIVDGFKEAYNNLRNKGVAPEEAVRRITSSKQFQRIPEVLASADAVKRARELVLSLRVELGLARGRKPPTRPGAPVFTEARMNSLVQNIVLTNLAQLRQGKTSKARKDLEKLGFDAEDAKRLVELAGSVAKKSKSKSREDIVKELWKGGLVSRIIKKTQKESARKREGRPLTETHF